MASSLSGRLDAVEAADAAQAGRLASLEAAVKALACQEPASLKDGGPRAGTAAISSKDRVKLSGNSESGRKPKQQKKQKKKGEQW